ncbi:MAG: hypothetical protein WD689_11655 [Gaiellaceae bacterium]
MRLSRHVAACALVLLVAGALPGAVAATHAQAQAVVTRSVVGDDWSLPPGAPAANSGFFSESGSADLDSRVELRGFDLTWRQIQPTRGSFDGGATGSAQDMDLPSFDEQNADPRPFWMRLFASGTSWAPSWLAQRCSYTPVGPDYDGERHVPIWDPCVWPELREAWRELMVGQGLRSDPRLKFVYVPGAFTWVEFDYDMIDTGAAQGLTFEAYRDWHAQMLGDLVAIMGDYSYKLVYTGEDYPFSDRFKDKVALFARDAVAAGMGIRTGITELFNFHLNEVPAYGTTIATNGHLVTDDDWMLFDGRRVAGTENECYTDCGFKSRNPAYTVKMSNLKALQLRMNWIYVVPDASRLDQLAAHWRWVRRELGRRPENAPDAWVALRDAEDVYWRDRGDKKWKGFPYVRNLERWIVQRDVAPSGIARRGKLRHSNDPLEENGTAFESLRTNVALGRRWLFLDVDERFLGAAASAPIELKVTYRDFAGTAWRAEYRAAGGSTRSTPTIRGTARGTGRLRTVTFRIPDPGFDDRLAGGTDIALRALKGDLEASFVRVVKLAP